MILLEGADSSFKVQGYFRREVFTACFIMAAVWPVIYGSDFLDRNKMLMTTWVFTCFVMSSFTLLPVVKVESISLM